MRISELIEKLKDVMEKDGDVLLYTRRGHYCDDTESEEVLADDIELIEEYIHPAYPVFNVPKHLLVQ